MPGLQVDLPIVLTEVDGLQMGVLPDGTPFMSGRSLAGLCGIVVSTIYEWGPAWSRESDKERDVALRNILDEAGYDEDFLFFETTIDGKRTLAYPAIVCMAIIEYYAFEKGRETAVRNHRRLARAGLQMFIYAACGWDPGRTIPVDWQHFHDRLTLNPVPAGWFSVWVESSALIMAAMRRGLKVDAGTVPDISIGMIWGKHWIARKYDDVYGARTKHPHQYPGDAPQSAAEIEAWVYPLAALGTFRLWLQEVYIPDKFPDYIRMKARKGAIPATRAELLIEAFEEDLALTGS